MHKVFALGLAVAWAALGMGAPGALAQESSQSTSLKTLLGRGYDIKSVAFARGESTDNREAYVVTLQKEKSIAVCYFAAVNWINLSSASLEDTRRCEVR